MGDLLPANVLNALPLSGLIDLVSARIRKSLI